MLEAKKDFLSVWRGVIRIITFDCMYREIMISRKILNVKIEEFKTKMNGVFFNFYTYCSDMKRG